MNPFSRIKKKIKTQISINKYQLKSLSETFSRSGLRQNDFYK